MKVRVGTLTGAAGRNTRALISRAAASASRAGEARWRRLTRGVVAASNRTLYRAISSQLGGRTKTVPHAGRAKAATNAFISRANCSAGQLIHCAHASPPGRQVRKAANNELANPTGMRTVDRMTTGGLASGPMSETVWK